MKDVDRSHAFDFFDKFPKWVAVVMGAGAAAIGFAFQSLGSFSEGNVDFSIVGIAAIVVAVWYFRDLWHRIWFWLILTCVSLLHAALAASVPIPPFMGHGSGGYAGIAIWLFEYGFIYGCIRFAERWSQGWPKTIEVPCRICGADVDKHAVQCPHCGTWSPAPPSPWIILIALAPMFCVLIFALVLFGLKK